MFILGVDVRGISENWISFKAVEFKEGRRGLNKLNRVSCALPTDVKGYQMGLVLSDSNIIAG